MNELFDDNDWRNRDYLRRQLVEYEKKWVSYVMENVAVVVDNLLEREVYSWMLQKPIDYSFTYKPMNLGTSRWDFRRRDYLDSEGAMDIDKIYKEVERFLNKKHEIIG